MEGNKVKMLYRYLGNSGLRVSALSYGTWLTAHDQESEKAIIDCVKAAWDNGVNFFDTAEIYGTGVAETILGKALKALPAKRKDYVVSTKFIKCGDGQNDKMLGAKHLYEGVEASLERMGCGYFDVIFCHRPDVGTPLEETCRAMNQLINDRKAFYWATSEWSAARVTRAVEICRKHGWAEPIAEQCQYHALHRDRFENEYREIYEWYGYGTTIWSPLAGGILAGKYNDGSAPVGSRYNDNDFAKNMIWPTYFGTEEKKALTTKKLQGLAEIAKELGCTQAQLALAWCIVSKDVSTCIFGATKVDQVTENMKALEVAAKWTQELEDRINTLLDNQPDFAMDFRTWTKLEPRRNVAWDRDFEKNTIEVAFPKTD